MKKLRARPWIVFACLASASVATAERLPPVANRANVLPQMQHDQPMAEELALPQSMSLADFQHMALANNPTLTKAAAAVEAARGAWVQAGLYPNPNIAYLGSQIGDAGTAGQQGGYVEQEFVRGRKLPLSRAVAAREIAMAEHDFDAQRMRVLNDVRIHFYNALVAQRSLEISQELVQIGDRALKAAEDLFTAKEVSRVDVLQARVEVSEARISLVNAENRYQAAWRRLVAVAGVPAMHEAGVIGDLTTDMPEFTWEESIERILNESPELAATRLGVNRAIASVRRARVEPIPNITLQAGPQYDTNARGPVTNVNVVMSAPIFDYNQGNVRRAEAEVRAARAELARKELELTTRLASAFERYANARNQVTQYREQILPHAREAMDLVSQGYRQGEIGFLMLLTTQRTYFHTNLAYLDALQELWESSIAIDGLLLTDSLQATPETPPHPAAAATAPPPTMPFYGR